MWIYCKKQFISVHGYRRTSLNFSTWRSLCDCNCFFCADTRKHLPALYKLLFGKQSRLSYECSYNCRPITATTQRLCLQIPSAFVLHSCFVNKQTENFSDTFVLICKKGYTKVIRLLLDLSDRIGLDLQVTVANKVCKKSKFGIWCCVWIFQRSQIGFCEAIAGGHDEIVKMMLDKAEALRINIFEDSEVSWCAFSLSSK